MKEYENKPDIGFMTDALEQYYEAAGFDDYYNRELKGKSDSEIEAMYHETFPDMIQKE